MGRCAGVVLVVALMCACVGAAAAKESCLVKDVLVGSGGPAGAWNASNPRVHGGGPELISWLGTLTH